MTMQECLKRDLGINQDGLNDNIGGCQSRANDYARGWESATNGDGTPQDRAKKAYDHMVSHNASLGRVAKHAFIRGFVAACLAE